MELSALNIYLLTVIPKIGTVAFIAAVISAFVCIMLAITLIVEHDEPYPNKFLLEKTPSYLKKALVVAAISVVLVITVPSKNTLIGMVTIPYLINNTSIKELPKDVIDTITHLLRKYGLEESSNRSSTNKSTI